MIDAVELLRKVSAEYAADGHPFLPALVGVALGDTATMRKAGEAMAEGAWAHVNGDIVGFSAPGHLEEWMLGYARQVRSTAFAYREVAGDLVRVIAFDREEILVVEVRPAPGGSHDYQAYKPTVVPDLVSMVRATLS